MFPSTMFSLVTLLYFLIFAEGSHNTEGYGDTMSDCIPELKKSLYCEKRTKYRTLDGSCNNAKKPTQGAAFTKQQRFLSAKYYDKFGVDSPIGLPGLKKTCEIPTPIEVADKLFKTKRDENNSDQLSNLHMAFGQFLDHDLSLTPKNGHAKCSRVPKFAEGTEIDFAYPCLPIKYSHETNSKYMKFIRSKAICEISPHKHVREQANIISSYIDASMVYGVNETKLLRIREDRKFESGRLRLTTDGLLPYDPESENDCRTRGGCFLAGDIRVDEHIALVSFHTLFVREHNRIAEILGNSHLDWSGDKIFNETRKIIGAMLQHITFNEYVPTLAMLDKYNGYNPIVDASIANSFSTSAFRFGHSQIRDSWAQLNENFEPIQKNIPLRETFFNNTILFQNGIEPTFYGLMANQSQSVDCSFAPGISKHLFQPPGHTLLNNLAALNIQRGRDHGLPGYNEWRAFCGLKKVKKFSQMKEITKNRRQILRKLYNNIDNNIDLFAAGLAEKHVDRFIVGPTFNCIMKKQFEQLRDGDRFYYKRPGVFTKAQLKQIEKVTLAKILCDNLDGVVSMQKEVFKAFQVGKTKRFECSRLPGIDLKVW